ncbi:sensor histidine kinase [Bacteroidota bacterium]
MNQNNIRFIIILGTITIAAIIIIQVIWMRAAWNTSEKQFNQSVHIALQNVADHIFQYNETDPPIEYPVNQMSSSYFIVNTNSEIDPEILEYYLISEFKAHNLNVDFEFGIYNCADDRMVYGKYINADGISLDKKQINLPKSDEYIYYFGINFPKKSSHIINEMSVWIIFSSILLIVVVFLSYALTIILQQKRFSEQQKDFINNMTHEFKTPISSIKLSTNVLLNSNIIDEPERLATYVELIKKENNRLNEQVEKVLNISRIERKEFQLNKEEFNAQEIIQQVFESLSISNSNKITCEYKTSNTIINGDKLHFTNILFNLADNAIKYSNENPEILVLTKNERNKLIISIIDKGIGITKEQQKHIFKKFYRVPTGNLHNVKGFGLGLFYVKTICKLHKWKIKLESEVNLGTEIDIIIKQ